MKNKIVCSLLVVGMLACMTSCFKSKNKTKGKGDSDTARVISYYHISKSSRTSENNQNQDMGQYLNDDGLNTYFGDLKIIDDEIYLFGSTNNTPTNYYSISEGNAFLMKLDKNGKIIWEKDYGFPGESNMAHNMFHLSNGNLLLRVNNFDSPQSIFRFLEVDKNGEINWQKQINVTSDVFFGIDAKYYERNMFLLSAFYKSNYFTFSKHNENLEKAWEKTFSFQDVGSIIQTIRYTQSAQNYYFVVGLKHNDVDYIIVLKTGLDGNIIYQKSFLGVFPNLIQDIFITDEDHVVLTIGGAGYSEVLSLDSSGSFVSGKKLSASGLLYVGKVEKDNDGKHLINTVSWAEGRPNHIRLYVDNSLDLYQEKGFISDPENKYNNYYRGFYQTNDDHYLIAGEVYSFDTEYYRQSVWLLKESIINSYTKTEDFTVMFTNSVLEEVSFDLVLATNSDNVAVETNTNILSVSESSITKTLFIR